MVGVAILCSVLQQELQYLLFIYYLNFTMLRTLNTYMYMYKHLQCDLKTRHIGP
jgi:hypothetical protein